MSWWKVIHKRVIDESFFLIEDEEMEEEGFLLEENEESEISTVSEEVIRFLGFFDDFEMAYAHAFEYAAALDKDRKDSEDFPFYGTYRKNKIEFTVISDYNEDDNRFVTDLIEIERIEEKNDEY